MKIDSTVSSRIEFLFTLNPILQASTSTLLSVSSSMPIALPIPTSHPIFPSLTRDDVDSTRISAWYRNFQYLTIPSTIIDIASLGEWPAFFEVGKEWT